MILYALVGFIFLVGICLALYLWLTRTPPPPPVICEHCCCYDKGMYCCNCMARKRVEFWV